MHLTAAELEAVREAVQQKYDHLQTFRWTKARYARLLRTSTSLESALEKIENATPAELMAEVD